MYDIPFQFEPPNTLQSYEPCVALFSCFDSETVISEYSNLSNTPCEEMRVTMSPVEMKTPEELFMTLMRTRVMIWDHNIARLRRKSSGSAPLHYQTITGVENKRKLILKQMEVIQETSGDLSTIQAQVQELKTRLYDDLASIKEIENPKPAITEDSNDEEMSGAQKEQSHDELELVAEPHASSKPVLSQK